MSVFASHTTVTREVPFDLPHTITICKLSGRQMERALKAKQSASMQDLREMGGAAFFKDMQALSDDDMKRAASARDPFEAYDADTLLTHGLKGWTYEQPVNAETSADLDEDMRLWAAREIFALSRRRSEADAKNG